MEIFVSRQPIFDRQQEVVGYELSCAKRSDPFQGYRASLNEIGNTLLLIGLNRITGGKQAFIPVLGDLLLHDAGLSLPEALLVIEILEEVEPAEMLVETCRKLKEAGYRLVLGDFIIGNKNLSALLELVDIIKVDFTDSTPERRKTAIADTNHGKIRRLADRVGTREEFQEAYDAGFDLFQGFFFSKPAVVTGRDIPGYKLNNLKILNEVNRKDIDFADLEKVIRQDVTLSYKLLNFINSAFFGLRYDVSSIRHALTLLGEREIRRWASLVILCGLGEDKPSELLTTSLVRANLCEALASQAALEDKGPELFLMGLFSLVDVLVGRPMDQIVQSMPLAPDIKKALCGAENRYSELLKLVLDYERGDLEQFLQDASNLSIDEGTVTDLYLGAIEKAEEALRSYGPKRTKH
jgi:c-di-GMP-related signal transduction protein